MRLVQPAMDESHPVEAGRCLGTEGGGPRRMHDRRHAATAALTAAATAAALTDAATAAALTATAAAAANAAAAVPTAAANAAAAASVRTAAAADLQRRELAE